MTNRDVGHAGDSFDAEEATGLPEFLKDPRQVLQRRWRWMLGCLLVGLVATVAYSFTVKPTFRATAILLVSSQQIPEEFVRPTVRDDSNERMNAMIGSILSSDNLRNIIEEHGLYPALRDELPMSDIVEVMRREVEIETVQGVNQSRSDDSASRYAISFTDGNPKVAAVVANEVASLFTELSIETREQRARLTTEFLRRQLADSEKELREQERTIREFKESHRGELPDELEANLRKLEQLQSQRQSLAMQIAEAETRLATIVSTVDPNSPEARLANLKSKLAAETAVHTDEHPNVTSLRRQIASVEQSLAQDARAPGAAYASRSALVGAERHTIAQMRLQQAATEAELAEIDIRIANTPKRQEELGAYEEKASVLRENYREFLQKVQDAELAQNLESAQQGERVVVLDRAAEPSHAVRSRRKHLILGLVAAVGLSLALGFLLEIVDPVVVSPSHVEATFGLPVLGSVSRIA